MKKFNIIYVICLSTITLSLGYYLISYPIQQRAKLDLQKQALEEQAQQSVEMIKVQQQKIQENELKFQDLQDCLLRVENRREHFTWLAYQDEKNNCFRMYPQN